MPEETLEQMAVCNLYEPIAQRDATLARAVLDLQRRVGELTCSDGLTGTRLTMQTSSSPAFDGAGLAGSFVISTEGIETWSAYELQGRIAYALDELRLMLEEKARIMWRAARAVAA